MANTDLADRNLIIARELRAAAEEMRRALQMSRDLVERSRRQTRAIVGPNDERAADSEHPDPSKPLVECLIHAYELAEADGEPQTRVLLGQVLHHVGRRIATGLGPSAAKLVVH
ncbi:hypothetical protein MKK88_15620 [Methylobacterium sp. E-005]|uniref:hypothetical protein n=1 Tax=Methylobacterium sp. E-005 TaxID=2836549 RepID=UPI001FBA86D7|nr:hypothetical protein [Methylobacterium sp. E-005]MCJ2087402.1 hypothetical protein [Methylobacterium sp. E-005]